MSTIRSLATSSHFFNQSLQLQFIWSRLPDICHLIRTNHKNRISVAAAGILLPRNLFYSSTQAFHTAQLYKQHPPTTVQVGICAFPQTKQDTTISKAAIFMGWFYQSAESCTLHVVTTFGIREQSSHCEVVSDVTTAIEQTRDLHCLSQSAPSKLRMSNLLLFFSETHSST